MRFPTVTSRRPFATLRRPIVALCAAALAASAAACGSGSSASPSASVFVVGPPASGGIVPVVANGTGDLAVGHVRLLFLLVDAANKPVSSPDRKVRVSLTPPAGSAGASASPAAPVDATFIQGGNGNGYYVANVTFTAPGTWRATFDVSGPGSATASLPFELQVADKPVTVQVGQKAPSVKTPTAADVGGQLAAVSTDPSPDPAFYQVSEDQALAQHKPFVLIFATPKFCVSALCGPTLDRLKAIAASYPDVTFINVEPYKMQFSDGQLQPILDNGQLQPNDASNAFAITAEPWVFTVDRDGIIRGSLEAVFGDDELKAAIDRIE